MADGTDGRDRMGWMDGWFVSDGGCLIVCELPCVAVSLLATPFFLGCKVWLAHPVFRMAGACVSGGTMAASCVLACFLFFAKEAYLEDSVEGTQGGCDFLVASLVG